MNIRRPLTRNERFLLLALVPVYFIVAGFILQPAGEIFDGVLAIMREPDFLIILSLEEWVLPFSMRVFLPF